MDAEGPADVETTHFAYNGANTWADLNAAGQVIARYLYGTQIDEVIARWQPANGTAWYLTDRLGSVRDLVDVAGLLINHVNYDSFGRVLSQTNAATGDRFLFTARELDVATQQYYFRARFYDASTGQFTQQDPLGFRASDYNLYRYVLNQVTNATDPTGRLSLVERAAIIFPFVAFAAECAGIGIPFYSEPV